MGFSLEVCPLVGMCVCICVGGGGGEEYGDQAAEVSLSPQTLVSQTLPRCGHPDQT